jgi:hypothetical protein
MPTPRTECTELSVGFGLLGQEPLGLSPADAEYLFENTLSAQKYAEFEQEFRHQEQKYRRFYSIGLGIRSSYPHFAQGNIATVRWEGPQQQAKSVSAAKDLVLANTSISVKDKNDIVANLSPTGLFVCVPKGHRPPPRSENWFLTISPELYQEAYGFIRSRGADEFPETIGEFYKTVHVADRKGFAQYVRNLSDSDASAFKSLYRAFCHDVASKSAAVFNKTLSVSLASAARNTVEEIIRTFFRIGENAYIVCGVEKRHGFAVVVPDLTSWRRSWSFKSLKATPDDKAGQSIVRFDLVVIDKASHEPHAFPFRAEIRWTHGKFGGTEAKLYKEFRWTDVPFFSQIYDDALVVKHMIIGSGGYGTVYKGRLHGTREPIAIKELSLRQIGGKEGTTADIARKRFEREVNIQSGLLKHSNILPIMASDLSIKTPWFAAPLALCSLDDILPEVSCDHGRLERVYWQVLYAIEYAHTKEVVHRDLKPGNILLFGGDKVMVSDFGLGKELGTQETGGPLTHTSDNVGGTWAYSAPEQFGNLRDADYRADIFALGRTLIAMLIGEEPDSEFDLADIDDRYRGFIERCIDPDPGERFQSMEEVIAAFDEITGSNAPTAMLRPRLL